MTKDFFICDVFTRTKFGGNQLAVLPDATGLSTEQMQQLAREFNFSESTFVFPSENGHTRAVRIFTPTTEVPFAGHPNVGTAYVLYENGLLDPNTTQLTFEEKAGIVTVGLSKEEDQTRCTIKAPEPLSVGKTLPVDVVAEALSLSPDEIQQTTHEPVLASVGLPFIVVELKSKEALENAKIYTPGFEKIHRLGIMPDIHVYVRSEDAFDLRTRMFAPFDGVPEDPATGSANCALSALLAHSTPDMNGEYSFNIAQGVEMGRPSELQTRVKKMNGMISEVWVGGFSKLIASGKIYL